MEKRKRPRALTLTLPNANQPFLMLQGKKYTLRNFSEEGIGLWLTTPAPFGLQPGSRVSGDILVGNHIYPVKLEVVHESSRVAGLRIVHKSSELTTMFQRLLEPTTYARTLKAHPHSGHEDLETGYPRLWYEGQGGAELLLWYNDPLRMVISLQLCWLGSYVLREQFQPQITGLLCDDPDRPGGARLREEDFIVRHEIADPELIQQAALFLTALSPPLPGPLLWQFLETGEQVYLPEILLLELRVA